MQDSCITSPRYIIFSGRKLKKPITANGLPEGRAARTQSHLEWGETMEISLIGAGNIGACLARKLKDAGHTVRIANFPRPRDSRRPGEGGRRDGGVGRRRRQAVRRADYLGIDEGNPAISCQSILSLT